MRVDIYNADGSLEAAAVDLDEAMGDDVEQCASVRAALEARGEAMVGGGAAPLFRLTRAADQ